MSSNVRQLLTPCPKGFLSEQGVSRVLFNVVIHLRPGVAAGLVRSQPVPPPSQPKPVKGFEGAPLKAEPIRPCSRRGLPSLRCRHPNWWALTSPFHPFPTRHCLELQVTS